MTRAPKPIRRPLRALGRDDSAVVLIEMAYALPIMLLVGFGGMEIASLTLANTQMSQIALTIADNSARIASGSNLAQPQVREVDINDVFEGARIQSGNLNLQQFGRVRLSSLEQNAAGGQWIRWQRCYGNLKIPARYGQAGTGATGTGFPGMGPAGKEVKAPLGGAVMFVEVTYHYQPLLFASVLSGSRLIKSDAAYTVREARDRSQVYNPAPTATASNCLASHNSGDENL